jgi:nicotinamide-nucleotide amidase
MNNAEIIAIGSEMLTPFNVDTNSLWLTERLNAIGIDVRSKSIVGDEESCLEDTIRQALGRSEVIISTGGLGPTEDDITRKVFARVLRRRLILNEEVLSTITARFARRNMRMPEINSRQALVLEGATVLDNPKGTAPGLLIRDNNRTIVLLPGPPREMKPMFDTSVMPLLHHGKDVVDRRAISIFGLTESGVDEICAPIYRQYLNPTTTILFRYGQIELHLTAKAASHKIAEGLLDELSGKLEAVLSDNVCSRTGEPLNEVVAALLKRANLTIATAESCTGGKLAARLTDIPGSSQYFIEGVVAYANEAKISLLGVPPSLIETHGAVSAEVAEAMASGIRSRAGSSLGVGITGIAGPDGGTEDKPVGLVFIGLATEEGTTSRRYHFPGDRQLIRELSVQAALDLVRRKCPH